MSDDATRQRADTPFYEHPAGGWGSVRGMAEALISQRPTPGAMRTLLRQNKPGGHMCTSCAWTKPATPHPFEFCENGAKATIWDLTSGRCGPEFFADRTLAELRGWSDHDLEAVGRLTHPMRHDPASDRYVETTWDEAFAAIGERLAALDPRATAFYASGRASLETSYLFQLFARLLGHNNLPDSSNMCHETTSVALKRLIGSPVGTCTLDDFDACDMILFFGQNTGTNSPRFLHTLQEAARRGCRIVSFNPIRERGLVAFAGPQSPAQMTVAPPTIIADLHLQVRPGGDVAAIAGLIKRVLEQDARLGRIVDRDFVDTHTEGFDAMEAALRGLSWEEVERESGIARADLWAVADAYCASERVIGVYGMGLTQHVRGWLNLAMLVNLLLLRGNVGRPGAGISPVRGHSNVQGQRTVGISEKPELVPLDKLGAMFGFDPPRETGMTTVEVAEALEAGRLQGFVGLGGNFARALPDNGRLEAAWAGVDLNVQIATKLNRSHLLPGRSTWLLPCLVRAEEDVQASGPQVVTMEDSLSMIHGSQGRRRPASPHLLSEPAIVAGIAKATLPPNPKVDWDGWIADYARVRSLIEETWPDKFRDFEARKFTPGGFHKGNPARERRWETESGRAAFTAPEGFSALVAPLGDGELTLVTLRSNDQFNTTVYGMSDRLRGIEGARNVVLVNPEEMARRGLVEGQVVTVECAVEDGIRRAVGGLVVTPYDLPDGCVGAYYPEANPLVPLALRDEWAKTPAYKGVPVRLRAEGPA